MKPVAAIMNRIRALAVGVACVVALFSPQPATTIGDGEPPTVICHRVASLPAGKPLTITGEVRDPAGVKWVHLRYRSVNPLQDYRTLPMLHT